MTEKGEDMEGWGWGGGGGWREREEERERERGGKTERDRDRERQSVMSYGIRIYEKKYCVSDFVVVADSR